MNTLGQEVCLLVPKEDEVKIVRLSKRHKTISKAWYDYFVLNKDNVIGIGEEIKESWKRSKNYHTDIYQQIILKEDPQNQQKSIEQMAYFIDLARPYMMDLFKIIKDTGFMITLTDKEGYIIDTYISPNILDNNKINVLNLSEKRVGTNAMGTCLYLDAPVETWAEENCHTFFHKYTTSAAPIHDPKGALIGCIGITGFANTFSSHTFGMVIAIADAIENRIRLSTLQNGNSFFRKDSQVRKQSVGDGIVIVNNKGHITSVNNVLENILGITEEKVLGKSIKNILPPDIDYEACIKEGKDIHHEKTVLRINHKPIVCDISITRLENDREFVGLIIIIKKVEHKQIIQGNEKGKNKQYHFQDIIGCSDPLKEAIKYATIASTGDSNVLLMGASGTGKELFAQSIHSSSSRKDQPFIPINCGALPLSLAESELFGYEEGAFTGAKKGGQAGKFELAHGGTLFLDEIGEMPLSMQASLLRVIQEREVVRIGATKGRKIDVRIIAATNKNLFEAVHNNTFRMDLFYRINVFTIHIPSLKERKEDISYLIQYFIHKYNDKFTTNIQGITPQALQLLENHEWLGNVRELENIIERAVQIAPQQWIDLKDLPIYLQLSTNKNIQDSKDRSLLEEKEYYAIINTLKQTKGNAKATAETLGIGRATLYRKLRTFRIDINQYR